jgi:hypothetical protein
LCRQALRIVGPGGSWGLATGAHVEATELWMAAGALGLDRRWRRRLMARQVL